MVFKGQTSDGMDFPEFDIKPRIVYPMEGGTALITFEDEAGKFVAQHDSVKNFRTPIFPFSIHISKGLLHGTRVKSLK